MPTGQTILDFGSFPGKTDAFVDIIGQAGILSTSLIETWIYPLATVDHSVDEHILETIKIFAHTITAGIGFRITGINTSQLSEGLVPGGEGRAAKTTVGAQAGDGSPRIGGRGTFIYGKWTVAWAWV